MNATFETKSQTSGQRAPQSPNQGSVAFPSRVVVQAKLEMTSPGDEVESEADAMAEAVVSGGRIARKISGGGRASTGIAVPRQMESRLLHSQGGGHPMPTGLQSTMERGFGLAFPQVRIHTDADAAAMSDSIGARAFTHGSDIYFNRGQFAPETVDGQRLVAHELTHVVQRAGKLARETNGGSKMNYRQEIIDHFNNLGEEEYERGELDMLTSMISETDFDWLLFAHPEYFRKIAKYDSECLHRIYLRKPDSFLRLRHTDLDKLRYIVQVDEDVPLPLYHLLAGKYWVTALQLTGKESGDLKITENNREDVQNYDYHVARKRVARQLAEGDTTSALEQIAVFNNYDFMDLLIHNKDMKKLVWNMYYEDFVSLFKTRFDALYYLYLNNYREFARVFNDEDCDIINKEIADPRGRHLVCPTLQAILASKRDLYVRSKKLEKLISEKDNEHTYFERELIKGLGNEELNLKDLRRILDYVSKDLNKITDKSSREDAGFRYAQCRGMVDSVEKRLMMYIQNMNNGEAQKKLMDYFSKTVAISVVSAGIGAGIGAIYSGGLLFDVVASGATGTVIELASQAVTSDYSGENLAKSTGTGAVGGAISHGAHLFIPGPAGKILADVLIGASVSWLGDEIQGSTPGWLPDEIHNDKLDIALFAYYMTRIGGIDYDESKGIYYVKKEIKDRWGTSAKEQHHVVEELNRLIKKTKTR